MTLPEITKISIRNLSRSKRRNVILGIAIAFGFFVVTVIDGLAGGAVSNLEDMTTQLMGGSVVIAGYEKVNENVSGDDAKNATTEVNVIRDHDYLQNLVDEMGIDYKYTSHYTRTMAQIIFHGKKVLCKAFLMSWHHIHPQWQQPWRTYRSEGLLISRDIPFRRISHDA